MNAHDAVVKGLIERYTREHKGDMQLDSVLVALGVPAADVLRRPMLSRMAAKILGELGYEKRRSGNRVVWRKAGAS